jgi:hypothetical protein
MQGRRRRRRRKKWNKKEGVNGDWRLRVGF